MTTTFHQVGETIVRFTFDWRKYNHHYQRFADFLTGMGVQPSNEAPMCWRLEMTQSQQTRWINWLNTLGINNTGTIEEHLFNMKS